jgi:hypothetical protein
VLRAALVYAAILGWQPLVAMVIVRRWVDCGGGDVGARIASTRFAVLSVVVPLILLAAAAALDALLWSRPPACRARHGGARRRDGRIDLPRARWHRRRPLAAGRQRGARLARATCSAA